MGNIDNERELEKRLNWCVGRLAELQKEMQEVNTLALELQGALKFLRGEIVLDDVSKPECTD